MNKDTFQWTPELWKKVIDTLSDVNTNLQKMVQSKISKKERLPLIGLPPEWMWKEMRVDELCAAISRWEMAGKEVPKEWSDELNELNTWIANRKLAAPKKEWEIVDCFDNRGNRKSWYPYDKDCNGFKCEIRSVRRLSDSVVFTVGDWYYVPIKSKSKRISHFNINEGGALFLNYKPNESHGLNITVAKKTTPPEQPKKERIEVKDVGIESILIKFEGRRLSVGKIEQVKAAIEKIINDD